MKEPKVEVGILFEPQIEFILLTPYHTSGKEVCGKQVVTYNEGRILGAAGNMMNCCLNLWKKLPPLNCWT